jgi:glucose/arabinose dehydrogenase
MSRKINITCCDNAAVRRVSLFVLVLLICPAAIGITVGQKDDFENGTTQGWISGSANPHPPVNVTTGGPAGTNDNYLRITSTGGFGAGSKLVAFNTNQWKGDYTSANIASISMDVRNFGTTNLTLRLAIKGSASYISSKSGISLTSGSGWQNVTFPVTAANLSGSSINATLANVTEIRLLHSTTPDYQGDPITATLGIDNILAQPAVPPPPDITWTFSSVQDPNNNNLFAYKLISFSPAEADLGDIGELNPIIHLMYGKRYAVTIVDAQAHPFEVIAKGDTDINDTLLLSQSAGGGLFQKDPNVALVLEGSTITFTLTHELANAMTNPASNQVPGYRCRVHSFSERGDFTISNPPIAALIGTSPVMIDTEVVASGLTAPVAMVSDPTQSDRLYIVDQSGPVYIIEQGQLLNDLFMDVNNLLVIPLGIIGTHDVNDYDERGFLGMAFHPGYTDPNAAGYRRLYTYTSEPVNGTADFTIDVPQSAVDHQNVIREWRLDTATGKVDPNSSRVIIREDHPQFNHNAGELAFGPDGYLYFGIGDGGGANDKSPGHGTHGNAQNINRIQGKILRIDPLDPNLTPSSPDPASANGKYRIPKDNPFVSVDGLDEIYAYGFRNPFRFGFDKESGILIVADVGQNHVEELDIVMKGYNYGWNLEEGTFAFDPNNGNVGLPLNNPNLTGPVAQYDHDDGIAVIGGYSYYGTEVAALWGSYVFGDFSRGFFSPDGRLFTADLFTGKIQELLIGPDKHSLGMFVKGMGQDSAGDVYVLASTALGPYGNRGQILKIAALKPSYVAELTSASADTNSPASGKAFFVLSADRNSMSYELTVNGIENVTQTHIHVSDIPGGSGSPAVWLYPSAPPSVLIPGEFSGVLAHGTFTDANFVGPLAGITMEDLLRAISENRAYVNVHTSQFPAGEIRGAITRVIAEPPINAQLSGADAGTNSQAIGRAILTLNSDTNSISYQLEVLDIENVTQAHIHVSDVPFGSGSPAVWLYPGAPPATLIPGKFRGILGEGSFDETNFVGPLAGKPFEDLLIAIQENRAYVNVHTQQFPAGEIRALLK